MRPGSATSLPDSTASTGLPCLSVGACEHHGRSNIEVDHMATTTCISHSVHDTNKAKEKGQKDTIGINDIGILNLYFKAYQT